MGLFRIVPLIATTDGDGAATVTSSEVNGLLYGVHEDKGTLSNGVDLTLAVVNSEKPYTLLTLTNADTDNTELFPRVSSCGNTGTVGTDQLIMLPVTGQLKLTIAQGGAAHTGGLYAWILED
jgi:hypothetical protein